MILKLLLSTHDMDHIYKNIEDYNPNKEKKILIVFDMIADILSNKKPNPIITELFNRGRKYFTCFYHTILFRCSKKCYTKFNTLF